MAFQLMTHVVIVQWWLRKPQEIAMNNNEKSWASLSHSYKVSRPFHYTGNGSGTLVHVTCNPASLFVLLQHIDLHRQIMQMICKYHHFNHLEGETLDMTREGSFAGQLDLLKEGCTGRILSALLVRSCHGSGRLVQLGHSQVAA